MEMIDRSTGTTTMTTEPSTYPDEELEVASVQAAPEIQQQLIHRNCLTRWTGTRFCQHASSLSKVLISRLADGGHLIIHHPLRFLMTLMGFASVLAAIVALAPVFQGQIISEEGLELAKWTAWKDFRDESQETKKKTAVSEDCEEAIRTPLPPPPHVSIHAATVRRALGSHNETFVLPAYVHVALSVGAMLVASILVVLLCHRIHMDHRMKSLARYHLSIIEGLIGSDGPVDKSVAETQSTDENKAKKTKPDDDICKKCENLEDKFVAALKYQEGWEDMQDKLPTALKDLQASEAERGKLLVTSPSPSGYPTLQMPSSQQQHRRRRGYEWETGRQYVAQYDTTQQSTDIFAVGAVLAEVISWMQVPSSLRPANEPHKSTLRSRVSPR